MAYSLGVNEFLRTNQYLVSSNNAFFAIMQSDGNFCVYRGSGPNDNHGYVWGTQVAPGPNEYFAIMQSDGNFCVYLGSGPSDNRGYVWGTQELRGPLNYAAYMEDDATFCVKTKGGGKRPRYDLVWSSGVKAAPWPFLTKVAVSFWNDAGVVADFNVRWAGGESNWTGKCNNLTGATIRLDLDPNIPPSGTYCWAVADPVGGNNIESSAGFTLALSTAGSEQDVSFNLEGALGSLYFWSQGTDPDGDSAN